MSTKWLVLIPHFRSLHGRDVDVMNGKKSSAKCWQMPAAQ